MSSSKGRVLVESAFVDPALEMVGVAASHRSLSAGFVQGGAPQVDKVQELLLSHAMASRLEERPREHAEDQEGSLDHHDHPRYRLILNGCQAPFRLTGGVVLVKGEVRPHENVSKHGCRESNRDRVDDLPAGGEPGRRRERPENGHPHQHSEPKEHAVLKTVHCGPSVRGVIENRQVPDEEVDGPERVGNEWIREDLKPTEESNRQDRLHDRACQTENQKQRRDIADDQVLDHVGDDQLFGEEATGTEEHQQHQDDSRSEADLSPHRNRSTGPGELHCPVPVNDDRERQRHQFKQSNDGRTHSANVYEHMLRCSESWLG